MGKRVRIIEGKWKCASCDSTGIAGRLKVCPFCGNPRETDEAKFDFGEKDPVTGKHKAEAVLDEEGLEMAGAGSDWYCANCGTANRGDASQCKSCGANAEFAALSAPPPPPEPPKEPPKDAPKAGATAAKAGGGCGIGGCLMLLFAMAALIGVAALCWGCQTHEAEGQVTAIGWERAIHQERFTAVTKTDWRSDLRETRAVMPVDGRGERAGVENVRGCSRKERKAAGCETKSRSVACGSEEKCKTKDLGNGFAEEVCEDVAKYCDEKYEECWDAVYDDWCTFDTWEWRRLDTKKAAARDAAPKWPAAPAPGRLDRLVREERYDVDVAYEDGGERATTTHHPASEADFARWKVGMPAIVEVNNFGAVTAVRPK